MLSATHLSPTFKSGVSSSHVASVGVLIQLADSVVDRQSRRGKSAHTLQLVVVILVMAARPSKTTDLDNPYERERQQRIAGNQQRLGNATGHGAP